MLSTDDLSYRSSVRRLSERRREEDDESNWDEYSTGHFEDDAGGGRADEGGLTNSKAMVSRTAVENIVDKAHADHVRDPRVSAVQRC